jgi:hypothetical protein
MGEDRLAVLSAMRPWALSDAELVAGVDAVQALAVEVQATLVRPIRKALTERDRGCAFPACDRDARWTDAHHMIHWSAGGPSSVDNAVLVCSYHHDELHKTDNWTVFLDNDGLPTFIPPAHIDPQQKPRRNRYHRRP